MNAIEKFDWIVSWYANEAGEPVRELQKQENPDQLDRVSELVGESLTPEIVELFQRYDGDPFNYEAGSFLGHSLLRLEAMISCLEFSESRIKPTNPVVEDPVRSGEIVQQLVDMHVDMANRKYKKAGVPKSWHKIVFQCAPGMYGGPYVHPTDVPDDQKRAIIRCSKKDMYKALALATDLHDLERKHYNWDELAITAFRDGSSKIERAFYDLEEFQSSIPEGVIQPKYFHIKWVPVIEDHGGNYIGIDLDPGPKGKRGQVIVFGSDEQEMFVLANSWGEFLDLIITEIRECGDALLKRVHLHDYFKAKLV